MGGLGDKVGMPTWGTSGEGGGRSWGRGERERCHVLVFVDD